MNENVHHVEGMSTIMHKRWAGQEITWKGCLPSCTRGGLASKSRGRDVYHHAQEVGWPGNHVEGMSTIMHKRWAGQEITWKGCLPSCTRGGLARKSRGRDVYHHAQEVGWPGNHVEGMSTIMHKRWAGQEITWKDVYHHAQEVGWPVNHVEGMSTIMHKRWAGQEITWKDVYHHAQEVGWPGNHVEGMSTIMHKR